MFGSHKVPVNIRKAGLAITVDEVDQYSFYRRESSDTIVEKILLESPKAIMLVPVEPLTLPSRITPYLLLEFAKTVMLPPRAANSIFLKFPVEVGVFLPTGDRFDLLETVSLSPSKFTLYGTPRGGHVARIWKSEVYTSVPETDPLYEGVLKLEIRNATGDWLPTKRSVFDVHGMKLSYKENLVAAQAQMTVLSDKKAETEFLDSPLENGMKSSIELFRPGMLAVTSARYYMGEGL
jgi:hypothetical protein